MVIYPSHPIHAIHLSIYLSIYLLCKVPKVSKLSRVSKVSISSIYLKYLSQVSISTLHPANHPSIKVSIYRSIHGFSGLIRHPLEGVLSDKFFLHLGGAVVLSWGDHVPDVSMAVPKPNSFCLSLAVGLERINWLGFPTSFFFSILIWEISGLPCLLTHPVSDDQGFDLIQDSHGRPGELAQELTANSNMAISI